MLTCDDSVLTCVDSVDIARGKICVFSERGYFGAIVSSRMLTKVDSVDRRREI